MRLEQNQRCLFASNTAMQWLDIRLQVIGVAVVTTIAGIAIIQHQKQLGNPGRLPGILLCTPLGCGPQVPPLLAQSCTSSYTGVRSRAPTPCPSTGHPQCTASAPVPPFSCVSPSSSGISGSRMLTSALFLCPATKIPAPSLPVTFLLMLFSSQDLWAWHSHMPCLSQICSQASFPASL